MARWPLCRRGGGSSPRLRGTRGSRQWNPMDPRFIPAPAGNTRRPTPRGGSRPVHPRACGEHVPGAQCPKWQGGSSPRLRGTRGSRQWNPMDPRFIPAPAGNTRRPTPRGGSRPVHPRACGEHVPGAQCPKWQGGSSPRLRGTRGHRGRGGRRHRFIPAPAGNTAFRRKNRARGPVHPRACGEHSGREPEGIGTNGSSPRLRGTRAVDGEDYDSVRFIPAPAGNTPPRPLRRAQSPVHPRACGEHRSSR